MFQGNEQNNKYTGEQQANDFAILYKLTVELWPDEKRRPVLFGPDPHSLHGPTGNQLGWIAEWLDGMAAKKVPVHAVTHHQYTEVDPSPAGFTSATKLSLNGAIAAAINKTVREHSPTARVFGGEIGPHNGGSPPCDHTSMRTSIAFLYLHISLTTPGLPVAASCQLACCGSVWSGGRRAPLHVVCCAVLCCAVLCCDVT